MERNSLLLMLSAAVYVVTWWWHHFAGSCRGCSRLLFGPGLAGLQARAARREMAYPSVPFHSLQLPH